MQTTLQLLHLLRLMPPHQTTRRMPHFSLAVISHFLNTPAQRATALLFVLLSACFPIAAHSAEALPFIAGFERFGRDSATADGLGGRLLISELSCTACHSSTVPSLAPKRGPVLTSVGSRIQRTWLERYLTDPQLVKPGTTMPHLLNHLPKDQQQATAQSLVAYLSSLAVPFPELKSTGANPIATEFWRKGDEARGRQLFHEVGCVACHAADPDFDVPARPPSDLDKLISQLTPEDLEELGLGNVAKPVASVPLGDLVGKYTRQSLTYFLLNPLAVRPAGRMPNLKLQPAEAADLVAYLLKEQPPEAAPAATQMASTEIKLGQSLFRELRCINCHTVPGNQVANAPMATALAKIDLTNQQSCLRETSRGVPYYALDEVQHQTLATTLADVQSAANGEPLPPGEQVDLEMQRLNCYACHERDAKGGVGPNRRHYFENSRHVDIGDEGRLPPPLSGVGAKLTDSWLKKVFAGQGEVRPHLLVRMPVFPAAATGPLAKSFSQADPIPHDAPKAFSTSAKLADSGRTLMDAGCVQCHAVHGEQLPGVVGVDVTNIAARVRPQWFHDFLLNPAALKPRTRMPTFFPNGHSANQTVLAGNVGQQIAALWGYLNDSKQPLPDKLQAGKLFDFTLVPQDRPILLRTFMPVVGTHAIAVGFPQSVHIAFDAEHVRLAQAWRGKFLDAHGTWFDRFTPPAVPLGKQLINLPAGPAWAMLDSPDAAWPQQSTVKFQGYRLDAQGIPTFLYQCGPYSIEDRITPLGMTNLQRRFRITKQKATSSKQSRLWFLANRGREVSLQGTTATRSNKLTVTLSEAVADQAILHESKKQTEWRLPLEPAAETIFEVTYQW